jgi:hypothetical protein
MSSCRRGGYLSGFVVGAVACEVVVEDAELHERWLLFSVVVGFVVDNLV